MMSCNFCLLLTHSDLNPITEYHMDMLHILMPNFNQDNYNDSLICKDCDILVTDIFKFKSNCLELEDSIYNYITAGIDQINLEKIIGLTEINSKGKICRTCFEIIEDDLFIKIGSSSNYLHKQHQDMCLSDMNLSLTKEPAMCLRCAEMLEKYYNFVTRIQNYRKSDTSREKSASQTIVYIEDSESHTRTVENIEQQPICKINSVQTVSDSLFSDTYFPHLDQNVNETIISVETNKDCPKNNSDFENNNSGIGFYNECMEEDNKHEISIEEHNIESNSLSSDDVWIIDVDGDYYIPTTSNNTEIDTEQNCNTKDNSTESVENIDNNDILNESIEIEDIEITNNNVIPDEINVDNDLVSGDNVPIIEDAPTTFNNITEQNSTVDNQENCNINDKVESNNNTIIDNGVTLEENKQTENKENTDNSSIQDKINLDNDIEEIMILSDDESVAAEAGTSNDVESRRPAVNNKRKRKNRRYSSDLSSFSEGDTDSDYSPESDFDENDQTINTRRRAAPRKLNCKYCNHQEVSQLRLDAHMPICNKRPLTIIEKSLFQEISNLRQQVMQLENKPTNKKARTETTTNELNFSSLLNDSDTDSSSVDSETDRLLKSLVCSENGLRPTADLYNLKFTKTGQKYLLQNILQKPKLQNKTVSILQQLLKKKAKRKSRKKSKLNNSSIEIACQQNQVPLNANSPTNLFVLNSNVVRPSNNLILNSPQSNSIPSNTSKQVIIFQPQPYPNLLRSCPQTIVSSQNNNNNTTLTPNQWLSPKNLDVLQYLLTTSPKVPTTTRSVDSDIIDLSLDDPVELNERIEEIIVPSNNDNPEDFNELIEEITVPFNNDNPEEFNELIEEISVSSNNDNPEESNELIEEIIVPSDNDNNFDNMEIQSDEDPLALDNVLDSGKLLPSTSKINVVSVMVIGKNGVLNEPEKNKEVPENPDSELNLAISELEKILSVSNGANCEGESNQNVDTNIATELQVNTTHKIIKSSFLANLNEQNNDIYSDEEENNDFNAASSDIEDDILQNNEISTDKEQNNEISADKEQNNEISTDKEQNNEISTDKEQNNEISTDKEQNNEISTDKEQNNEISADKEQNNEISTDKEQNNEISTDKEQNSEISADKEQNNEISTDKEQNNEISINKDQNNEIQLNSNCDVDNLENCEMSNILGNNELDNVENNNKLPSNSIISGCVNSSSQLNLPSTSKINTLSSESVTIESDSDEDVNENAIKQEPLVTKVAANLVLNNHHVNPHELAIFKCHWCMFNTRYFQLIDMHVLTHFQLFLKNASYACQQCSKSFRYSYKLYKHLQIDHSFYCYKLWFWCVSCAVSFANKNDARLHYKQCPKKSVFVKLFKSNDVFYCMLCNYETTNLNRAKAHTKKCNTKKFLMKEVIELE